MGRVKIALIIALTAMAVAIPLVLQESPPKVLAINSPREDAVAAARDVPIAACQGKELLPRDTTAIRLSLSAFTGPRVTVKVISGGRVLETGSHGSGWSGANVTVPVKALSRTVSPVEICFAVAALKGETLVYGTRTGAAVAAHTSSQNVLSGRVKIAYLGAGRSSWFGLAVSVARRMGLGRAWSGTWVAFFVAMLMLLATASVVYVILRELHDE
jgi:hypothetical protein